MDQKDFVIDTIHLIKGVSSKMFHQLSEISFSITGDIDEFNKISNQVYNGKVFIKLFKLEYSLISFILSFLLQVKCVLSENKLSKKLERVISLGDRSEIIHLLDKMEQFITLFENRNSLINEIDHVFTLDTKKILLPTLTFLMRYFDQQQISVPLFGGKSNFLFIFKGIYFNFFFKFFFF